MIRVGFGYDVHALESGKKLVIGGVTIPFPKGLAGHSDADVLVHAVIDALLGAAGLGDIGGLFPDTNQQFKDIDSRILLRKVQTILAEQNFSLHNIDSTVVAQAPKLRPYIDQMKHNLASDLQVPTNVINVKATTTDYLGFAGREEGIAAYGVCAISQML